MPVFPQDKSYPSGSQGMQECSVTSKLDLPQYNTIYSCPTKFVSSFVSIFVRQIDFSHKRQSLKKGNQATRVPVWRYNTQPSHGRNKSETRCSKVLRQFSPLFARVNWLSKQDHHPRLRKIWCLVESEIWHSFIFPFYPMMPFLND